jgi:hypothetical protein
VKGAIELRPLGLAWWIELAASNRFDAAGSLVSAGPAENLELEYIAANAGEWVGMTMGPLGWGIIFIGGAMGAAGGLPLLPKAGGGLVDHTPEARAEREQTIAEITRWFGGKL